MRLCQCGGKITAHANTDGSDTWHCKSCGRWERHEPLADYPVIAAVHPITGSPIEFSLSESEDYGEWSDRVKGQGLKMVQVPLSRVAEIADLLKATDE